MSKFKSIWLKIYLSIKSINNFEFLLLTSTYEMGVPNLGWLLLRCSNMTRMMLYTTANFPGHRHVLHAQKAYILVNLTAVSNLQYLLQWKNIIILFEESAQQQNTFITATGMIHSPLKVNNVLTFSNLALICHPEGHRFKL